MRKPLNELRTEMETVTSKLKEVGKQKELSDVEYLLQCIGTVPQLSVLIDDKIDGTHDKKALEISMIENKKLWLAIEKGKPVLYTTEYTVIHGITQHTAPKEIPPEKAVIIFDIDTCGDYISVFGKKALNKIEKMKNSLPTSDQEKQKRKEFFKQLAVSAKLAAVEYQAIADAP